MKPPDQYSLHSSCTSCRYFSYCYQETLLKSQAPPPARPIVCVKPESADFLPNADDWPSIHSFLQKHFTWPVEGHLTATQVARCLGLMTDPPPPISLYHDDVSVPPDLYKQIWSWCASHVKSTCSLAPPPTGLIDTYLSMQRREWEERTLATLAFQKNPLATRVEQFRAIGPLTFSRHYFRKARKFATSFRSIQKRPYRQISVGDFLKFSAAHSAQIQDGFTVILTSYSPEEGTLSIQSLSDKMPLGKNQLYALDECATDWNAPKIETVLHRLKDPKFRPELIHMLHGHGKHPPSIAAEWVEQWYSCHAESSGPKCDAKTGSSPPLFKKHRPHRRPSRHRQNTSSRLDIDRPDRSCKIDRSSDQNSGDSTHPPSHRSNFIQTRAHPRPKRKIPIWKYGRFAEAKSGVEPLPDAKPLMQNTSFILGATGFGVYQLLEGKQFPRAFDWVIFDEASQMLPSYALLSLVFGKGNALFYGDTQQLPPIVTADIPARSILAELIVPLRPSTSPSIE